MSSSVYTVEVKGLKLTVPARFGFRGSKLLSNTVAKAEDRDRGITVAIKKIRELDNIHDVRKTLKAVKVMKLLGEHPNVSDYFICNSTAS